MKHERSGGQSVEALINKTQIYKSDLFQVEQLEFERHELNNFLSTRIKTFPSTMFFVLLGHVQIGSDAECFEQLDDSEILSFLATLKLGAYNEGWGEAQRNMRVAMGLE